MYLGSFARFKSISVRNGRHVEFFLCDGRIISVRVMAGQVLRDRLLFSTGDGRGRTNDSGGNLAHARFASSAIHFARVIANVSRYMLPSQQSMHVGVHIQAFSETDGVATRYSTIPRRIVPIHLI